MLSEAYLQPVEFPSSFNGRNKENDEVGMVDYTNFWYSPSRLAIPKSDLTATISAEKEEKQRFNI